MSAGDRLQPPTSGAAGPGPLVPAEDAEDLYEHAPCGYLSTLPDGTIIKVNGTLLRWTGHRRDDLVGRRRFAELLTAGGRIYHETHYAPALLMHGQVHEIAVDLVCADGRRLPVLVNAVLVRTPEGAPHVIRTSVFDATDRRAYERELLRARQRAEQSEERARLLAQTLQRSLLPPSSPAIPGLDVAAAYRPAGAGDEVGGDFYDVFETRDGGWAVVLGDVCGKGAQAAAVTALARYTLRAAAVREPRPAEALGVLNDALLRSGTERFCTVVLLHLRRRPDGAVQATIASGGHALPLLVRGRSVGPVGRAGALLGVMEDAPIPQATVVLSPGDLLFCYTDGIPEGRRGDEFYGEERLSRTLLAARDRGEPDVAHAVVDDVVAFQGGRPRDDIAAVAVGVPAAGPIRG